MATRIPDSARNAAAAAVVALLDAGTGPGYVEIRSGSQPATPATAASGTLLGTLTLDDPAFGAPSAGTVTAAAITDDTDADATDTAGWFRAYDSDSNVVIDGDITTDAVGTGDMTMDDTAIVAGGTISVSAWTITMPGA